MLVQLEPAPVLHGDGKHNDKLALRQLFLGFPVFCARAEKLILAQSIKALPPGVYRLIDPLKEGKH